MTPASRDIFAGKLWPGLITATSVRETGTWAGLTSIGQLRLTEKPFGPSSDRRTVAMPGVTPRNGTGTSTRWPTAKVRVILVSGATPGTVAAPLALSVAV